MRSLCAGKSELDRLKRTTGMLQIRFPGKPFIIIIDYSFSRGKSSDHLFPPYITYINDVCPLILLDIKLRLMPPPTSHHLSFRCLTRQDQNQGEYDCRCTSNQYDLILNYFSCLHTLKEKKKCQIRKEPAEIPFDCKSIIEFFCLGDESEKRNAISFFITDAAYIPLFIKCSSLFKKGKNNKIKL